MTSKVRILLLLHHWDPDAHNLFGPMTKMFAKLSNALVITVLTKRAHCDKSFEPKVRKYAVSGANRLYFFMKYLFYAIFIIKRHKIKVVYGHSLGYSAIILIILKLIYRKKIKTVFWLCGDGSAHEKTIDGNISVNKLIFIILHRVVDKMLSCCPIVGEDQHSYYKCSKHGLYDYIPNTFDPLTYYPSRKTTEYEEIRIIYSSRKSYRKGYDIFLEVVKKFAGHANIKFLSVGGGASFEQLEREVGEINPNFVTLDSMPQSKLAAELRNGHILLVPARYNGFARAYIEALASGLIVITRATQCTETFIKHDYNGLLVDDVDDIVLSISTLMEDKTRLRILQENALLSSEKYTLAVSAAMYLGVFESMSDNK